MRHTPVIILDLETTGLSPYKHKITEIAAVKMVDGEIIERFSTLIDPEIPIPRHITRITGITDEMVAGKPTIGRVLPQLKEFLGEHPIIAHNSSFDMKFLRFYFRQFMDISLDNQEVCTVRIARRVVSHLPSKKLSCICEYYGVVNETAHRALSDVLATAEVFYKMLSSMEHAGVSSFDNVVRFQSMPVYKAASLLDCENN